MTHQNVAVVLSFFAPVPYELPVRHFHAVLHTLHAQGIPLVVTQAVYPGGEAEYVPSCIPQAAYDTKSFLFHKERLWNLAAGLTDADKLIFLDADVVFGASDWLTQCVSCLDRFDIIQPYTRARWLDYSGRPDMERPPFTEAISKNLPPKFKTYHPGFGWGMTRRAFDLIGGFYDLSVCGNSDSLFALSLRDNELQAPIVKWFGDVQDPSIMCQSYKDYKKNASGLNLKVGLPKGVTLTHLWHGDRGNRNYVNRGKLFPRKPNSEYPCHTASTGLLEWDDLTTNDLVHKYFVEKKDDG
tara:strand:+ start:459 stop:1352 length:894 start_codon:yes stop_codon:yes gene_type:complete